MAELLQREFSLPVLKVRLLTEAAVPAALCQLVVNVDGDQIVHDERSWTVTELGFDRPSGTPSRYELGVPDQLTTWAANWAQGALGPDAVLWLHLVKPYGQLGAVPWERDLQPACGLPILRLPDVLPEAERSGSTFRVALCATAPALEGPSTAGQMGPEIARQIADGVGPRLRLEVFGDLLALDMLEGELAGLPGQVHVHRPPPDFADHWESDGGGRNQWLWWMRQAIGSTSLDAVHFVVHGVALRDEGAMLTPWSPTDPYRDTPQHVTARELRDFLTSVGALTLAFSAPFDNYSDYGLRHLADELGARRAGPVVLHDPRIDAGSGLREAYEFLTAIDPRVPPASPGLVMFAQPRRVVGQYQPATPEFEYSGSLAPSAAVKEHFDRDETPLWLATAERYLDEKQVELARFEQSKRTASTAQTAYYDGLRAGLEQIRAVVDQHATETL